MIDWGKMNKHEVKLVQKALESEGFELGEIDGIAGRLTKAAHSRWLHKVAHPEIELGTEFDSRTERVIASLDPVIQPRVRVAYSAARDLVASEMGVVYKLIGGNRTCDEQDDLYAQGRTRPGSVVTNARCGQSNHNFGGAVDGGVFDPATGAYLDNANPGLASKAHHLASEEFKRIGFEWGGDWNSFKDEPHMEWPSGLSLAEMQRRLKSGEAIYA